MYKCLIPNKIQNATIKIDAHFLEPFLSFDKKMLIINRDIANKINPISYNVNLNEITFNIPIQTNTNVQL